MLPAATNRKAKALRNRSLANFSIFLFLSVEFPILEAITHTSILESFEREMMLREPVIFIFLEQKTHFPFTLS